VVVLVAQQAVRIAVVAVVQVAEAQMMLLVVLERLGKGSQVGAAAVRLVLAVVVLVLSV
jgi:hypothetical protein